MLAIDETAAEVPGPEGRELSDWLKLAILFGSWALYQAVRDILAKHTANGRLLTSRLFLDDADRTAMRSALEQVVAPSLLIGRAKLQKAVGELKPATFVKTVKAARPLALDSSLEQIGPTILVASRPATLIRHRMERDVLERSALVEQSILDRIHDGIESDKTLAFAPSIDRLLSNAGLMPESQPYLATVIRTEVMDAINRGQWDEFSEEAKALAFPVWQYHAVIRPTSRLWHAARNGRYWPSTATFQQVRGFGPGNICGCLCNWTPVRRDRWDELRKSGVQLEPW